MKMRTPVIAFQMTSLHWQRSVPVNIEPCVCWRGRSLPVLFKVSTALNYTSYSFVLKNNYKRLLKNVSEVARNSGRYTCFLRSISGFISQVLAMDVSFFSVLFYALYSRISSTSKWKHW